MNSNDARRVLLGIGLLALALSTAWWPYSAGLEFRSMVANALVHGLVPTLLIWAGFLILLYRRDVVWSTTNVTSGAVAGLIFHIAVSAVLLVAMWKYLARCSDYVDICAIPIKASFDFQIGTFAERFRVSLILVFSKLVNPVGSVLSIFHSEVSVNASGFHVDFFGSWTYFKEVATKLLSVGLLVGLGAAAGFLAERRREMSESAA